MISSALEVSENHAEVPGHAILRATECPKVYVKYQTDESFMGMYLPFGFVRGQPGRDILRRRKCSVGQCIPGFYCGLGARG